MADGGCLVAAEVVHDDNVVGPQFRDQNLLDIGAEARAIDRPVDHPRGDDAVVAQGGDEGHGVPVTKGRVADQAFAAQPPAPKRGHVGLGPGFVKEHKAAQVDAALTRLPAGALAGNVGPVLLTGARGFF